MLSLERTAGTTQRGQCKWAGAEYIHLSDRFEIGCLAPVMASFFYGTGRYGEHGDAWNSVVLFGGIALSRIGLWSFDLCQVSDIALMLLFSSSFGCEHKRPRARMGGISSLFFPNRPARKLTRNVPRPADPAPDPAQRTSTRSRLPPAPEPPHRPPIVPLKPVRPRQVRPHPRGLDACAVQVDRSGLVVGGAGWRSQLCGVSTESQGAFGASGVVQKGVLSGVAASECWSSNEYKYDARVPVSCRVVSRRVSTEYILVE